jgi:hypothetical protein
VLRAIFCFTFALLLCAAPALANVTVYSPANGAQVTSPFQLSAKASRCSRQQIGAMGYSLDDSTDTTIVYATTIDAEIAALAGSHTVHVKSWGNQGAVCVTDVSITVVSSPSGSSGPTSSSDPVSTVPSNALVFQAIQARNDWLETNDPASGGGTSGSMSIVSSPSLSGSAREFATQFTNNGGELYYDAFGSNTAVSNFLYDGWVYISGSASYIGNLEMDLNQVMANGQTVIYGFQCDAWTNTWDYTVNAGTPTAPVDKWIQSTQSCNQRTWSTDTWHHVQITYSRDQYGNVTYKSVWLDGVEQNINVTAPSSFALGWSSVLLTNFQVDGYNTSGSSTVYLDNLTIYAW